MNTFGNPYVVWSKVALTTSELMIASAQVIGHRVARMALAGATPTAEDRREPALMGQEKIEALGESAFEFLYRMAALNRRFTALAMKEMFTIATGMMTLRSRTQGEQQARWVHDAVARPAISASRISGAAAQLTQRALKPVHSRATRNAKRLGKRRARA